MKLSQDQTTLRTAVDKTSAATAEEGSPSAQDPADSSRLQAVCILLVDDERAVRRVGEKALARGGYEVLTAENGRQAVQLYREHQARIALVILDMEMPEMNGRDTFKALTELDPNVRVLISSGYDAQETRASFAGTGLVGLIQKPYRVATLLECVRASLA